MIITLLTGILATSALTTSLPEKPNISTNYSFSQVISNASYFKYIVQEGDYISMIAGAYYGSEDYWTNIANDNPEIKDASQLEVGTVLKIRNEKTILPEALNKEIIAGFTTQPEVQVPVYTYSAENGATAATNVTAINAPTPTPQVAPQAVAALAVVNPPHVLSEEQITYLGSCEAGMDPAKNTGNGYYGAFQFSYGTWKSMGTGYERADLAPLEVQKAAVQRLVARSSIYTQFPGCARKMSSAGLI